MHTHIHEHTRAHMSPFRLSLFDGLWHPTVMQLTPLFDGSLAINGRSLVHSNNSTGALEFGLEKKCRKLIFSGYISGLPLLENVMSPQKSPLRVLHNLHIN